MSAANGCCAAAMCSFNMTSPLAVTIHVRFGRDFTLYQLTVLAKGERRGFLARLTLH
jgi:hypothetical protein